MKDYKIKLYPTVAMLNGKGEAMSFDDTPESRPAQMLIKAHLKATEAKLGLKHNQIVNAKEAVILRLEYGDNITLEELNENNSQRNKSNDPDLQKVDNGSNRS